MGIKNVNGIELKPCNVGRNVQSLTEENLSTSM